MKDYRIMLKGTKQNCEGFTIDLTWYHSAAAMITSIVRNEEDNTIILNLLAEEDRVEDIEQWGKEWGLKRL